MKLSSVTVTILVRGVDGEPRERPVAAWSVSRWFAVHRDVEQFGLQQIAPHFIVTHVPTGMAVASADSRDHAVRAARRLAAVPGMNWDVADPHIVLNLKPETRDAVRVAAGLHPLFAIRAKGARS